MCKIVHLPDEKKQDVIVVCKDKVTINGVECQSMDLDEFLCGLDISPDAEERFVRGLFQIIKEEVISDWRFLKIFKEIFRK